MGIALVLASTQPGTATTAPPDDERSCALAAVTSALARGDTAFKAGKHADAARHYTTAATCGRAAAQQRIGFMLLAGQGVGKDDKAAAEWLRKAAEQGDTLAQLGFAVQLRYGQGVPKDEATAYKWFIAAADKGIAEAQFNAGSMLLSGSVKPDQVEAAKWLYKAALQGHARAQSALALIETGVFTFDKAQRQSIIRAYIWSRLADRASCLTNFKPATEIAEAETHRRMACAESQRLRKTTSDLLTANELIDAGKLVDGWKPGSTNIPPPPYDSVAQLPLAIDVINHFQAAAKRAQDKPTRTRELMAVDRWMVGQMNFAGVPTFVAVLPVPERAKEKGALRLVCPERSPQGPMLLLSAGLFDSKPAPKTLLQHFNGQPVIGIAAETEVVIPIEVGVTLMRPEVAGIQQPNRVKLTADMLNAANGTFRFRMDGHDTPEIVIRQRLPYAEAARKDGMAGLLHRDMKPDDLRSALVKCNGFVKPSF